MDRKAALALGLQVMRDSPEWSEGRERAGVSATVRRKWLIGPRKSWVVRTRTIGRWMEVEINDATGEVLRCDSFGIR